MIILVCFVIGITLRLMSGIGIRSLSGVSLRGENVLLIMLVAQAMAPLLHLTGAAGRVAFYSWLATFPAMAVITWLNRRNPGMAVLGAGLVANAAVITANGGMPVLGAAMGLAKGTSAVSRMPTGDFVHVLMLPSTRLPWLADVIGLPGPTWLRAVVSPGDLLLFVGIVAFVASAAGMQPRKHLAAE